ncbi:MAG: hypothetical protein AVDCRST_MAG45-113, partial [uncultured Solirubrobacterales bacterium]
VRAACPGIEGGGDSPPPPHLPGDGEDPCAQWNATPWRPNPRARGCARGQDRRDRAM